jgi:ubiquinone biosynthesis protein
MMGKALMTVEGIGKQIFPELDLLAEAKPYFTELAWNRYSPEKISQDLMHIGTRLLTAASELPTHMQEILGDLRQGRLRIETRDPTLAAATNRLGRRMFSGMVVSAMLLSGSVLLAVDKDLPGGILLGAAAAWTTLHSIGLAFSRRRRD